MLLLGAVFYYTLFQLMVLWLCHIPTLFWGLKFPFQANAFKRSHRMKYLHIASVVVGVLVPFVPVFATMIQFSYGKSSAEAVRGGLGFGVIRFPPIICMGRHKDTTFYSLVLPLSIILMIGITLLIFVFWIIHKVRLNEYNVLFVFALFLSTNYYSIMLSNVGCFKQGN